MDIMGKVSEITRKVSDKAGEMVEMGKLSAKIRSETAKTEEIKKKIGEACFGKYRAGDVLDPEVEKMCIEIERYKQSIAENQRRLRRMKDKNPQPGAYAAQSFCLSCGGGILPGAKYCPQCGKKLDE